MRGFARQTSSMDLETVRLWATEELAWWPNRLHVLLAVLAAVVVLSTPTVLAVLLLVASVGSLLWRIHLWDRQRRRMEPLRVRVR